MSFLAQLDDRTEQLAPIVTVERGLLARLDVLLQERAHLHAHVLDLRRERKIDGHGVDSSASPLLDV